MAALLGGLLAPLVARAGARSAAARPAAAAPAFDPGSIERRVRGRLGVSVIDLGRGRRVSHRGGERFPMCSTFKWLLAAQVLYRVDAGEERLDRVVAYGESDLLEYAPVTRERIGEGGLSLTDLMAAAVELSDNTAANLLLAAVGGPSSLTSWLRRLGDRVTRLDRKEPELNRVAAGDPRDTTSPDAMVADLQRLLVEPGRLTAASQERLLGWLEGSRTGAKRIRAGLPEGWRVGDKTGTGAHGSTNDVAIVWPPGRQPLLVSAYLTRTSASEDDRNAALAEVGRQVARWVEGP